jgi:hypothetical protein
LSSHFSHFLRNLFWRLSDDLVHLCLRPDVSGFGTKLESLDGLCYVRTYLRNAADDGGLAFANERSLKNASEFAITEVDVIVVAPSVRVEVGSITQFDYDVRQCQ